MKLKLGDKTYPLGDLTKFSVNEGIVISLYSGGDLKTFGETLAREDESMDADRLKALKCLVWLARTRSGEKVDIAALDFNLDELGIEHEPGDVTAEQTRRRGKRKGAAAADDAAEPDPTTAAAAP